jgi:hypothetical protein
MYRILVWRIEKNTLKTKDDIKINVKYGGDYGVWTVTQDKGPWGAVVNIVV